MRESAVGRVAATSIPCEESVLGVVKAGEVAVSEGVVLATYANKVNLERSSVVFLLAKEVGGDARILLDWRAAAVFGAAIGLVVGFMRMLLGRRE